MTRCGRCDWQPSAEEDAPPVRAQLREHALEAAHPLCAVCGRSLGQHDPLVSCETCLSRAREYLAGIVTMWQELPRHLGRLTGRTTGSPTSEEFTLTGGTVLALLGPGSSGGASRFDEEYDPQDDPRNPERWWVPGQLGPLTRAEWMRVERERYGTEHNADNTPTDAPSVEQELASWAQDWSESGGPALPAGRLTVPRLHGYLEVHARWAANQHDAFAEFAEDMRALHLQLEQATGRYRAPTKAGASCFDCGGDLVRRLIDASATRWWVARGYGPLPKDQVVHGAGQIEEDHVTCMRCGVQYDQARYLLALAGRREEGLSGWVTVAAAASASSRSQWTVRAWVQDLQVPAACRVTDRRVVVWYPAVHDKTSRAGRRDKASA